MDGHCKTPLQLSEMDGIPVSSTCSRLEPRPNYGGKVSLDHNIRIEIQEWGVEGGKELLVARDSKSEVTLKTTTYGVNFTNSQSSIKKLGKFAEHLEGNAYISFLKANCPEIFDFKPQTYFKVELAKIFEPEFLKNLEYWNLNFAEDKGQWGERPYSFLETFTDSKIRSQALQDRILKVGHSEMILLPTMDGNVTPVSFNIVDKLISNPDFLIQIGSESEVQEVRSYSDAEGTLGYYSWNGVLFYVFISGVAKPVGIHTLLLSEMSNSFFRFASNSLSHSTNNKLPDSLLSYVLEKMVSHETGFELVLADLNLIINLNEEDYMTLMRMVRLSLIREDHK